jgi:hypothetical protein
MDEMLFHRHFRVRMEEAAEVEQWIQVPNRS